jgi:hypothetical protein
MPSPLFALKGKKTDSGVTNIRSVKSPHWRPWPAAFLFAQPIIFEAVSER